MMLIKEIPNHPLICYTGPDFDKGPLPALIYFSLSKEESLSLDPYNQPVQFIKDKGYRVFSFTLPFHDAKYDRKDAMKLLLGALEENPQFFFSFLKDCSDEVNRLIEEKIIDKNHVSTAGLSRGAFFATHLSAINDHIKTILGFAPLTSLDFLEESKINLNINSLNLKNLCDKLKTKHLRFYIGNHDTRVGTKECFDFINELTITAYNQGIRSPNVELIIGKSIGHKGHGTPQKVFEDGINWLLLK